MESQQAAKGFDVGQLAPASETTDVTIFDPRTRKDTDIVITVYGRDSKIYKDTIRTQVNRRTRQIGRRISTFSVSAEEMEEEALTLLVKCTKGWRGVILDGQEFPFSPANARTLYERVPVIREQVDEAIGDRNLFLSR